MFLDPGCPIQVGGALAQHQAGDHVRRSHQVKWEIMFAVGTR